jgi:hypothetical protein
VLPKQEMGRGCEQTQREEGGVLPKHEMGRGCEQAAVGRNPHSHLAM